MVSSRQIAIALYKTIKAQNQPKTDWANILLEYLSENKLLNLLPQIVTHLEKMNREDVEFKTLHIETADEIDSKILKQIEQKFGKPQKINQNKNAELIGGFVATYQGFIYDASVKNQLKLLKTKLIAN